MMMKTCRSLVAALVIPTSMVCGFQQQLPSMHISRPLNAGVVARPAAPAVIEEERVSALVDEIESLQDLPPVIQHIVDERNEFQMNLGKAMDTLRKDYPYLLTMHPDFSIYHKKINVVDPSGVQLKGLSNYKHSFTFYQTLIKILYTERSGLQFRMVYDFARSSIRVSWNVVLHSKVPLAKPLHVDGVSAYKLDALSGKIVEHKIDNLMINNTPVAPPYGIFSLIREELASGGKAKGVPVGIAGAAIVSGSS